MSLDQEGIDERNEHPVSSERLTQSWNGFANIDSKPSDEFFESFTRLKIDESHREQAEDTTERKKNSLPIKITSPERRINQKKPRTTKHRTVKTPKSFPGVNTTGFAEEKQDEKPKKIADSENQVETKLTLDDLQKVLTLRREQKPGTKARRDEKLPRIKITRAKTELEGKSSGKGSPQAGSHYFNCARMMTELDEVCSLKTTGVAGHGKSEDNLLTLKTVHEARRYSAFTPRGSGGRTHHVRCRSLPNLSTRQLPKRFFVKLDPFRASAMQVNLSSWNETSRRCRVLSENLNKLDKQDIELSEEERKVLIGQWVRETSQLTFEDNHVGTEVETMIET